MAHYDVYANPSNSAAAGIPDVVVIQSDLLDALATRLTVPPAVADASTKAPLARCPVITVKDMGSHALAHVAAPLIMKLLRRPVDHVAAQANELVSAIDRVLSGISFERTTPLRPSCGIETATARICAGSRA